MGNTRIERSRAPATPRRAPSRGTNESQRDMVGVGIGTKVRGGGGGGI